MEGRDRVAHPPPPRNQDTWVTTKGNRNLQHCLVQCPGFLAPVFNVGRALSPNVQTAFIGTWNTEQVQNTNHQFNYYFPFSPKQHVHFPFIFTANSCSNDCFQRREKCVVKNFHYHSSNSQINKIPFLPYTITYLLYSKWIFIWIYSFDKSSLAGKEVDDTLGPPYAEYVLSHWTIVLVLGLSWHCLTMFPRLASNVWFSCPSLLNMRMTTNAIVPNHSRNIVSAYCVLSTILDSEDEAMGKVITLFSCELLSFLWYLLSVLWQREVTHKQPHHAGWWDLLRIIWKEKGIESTRKLESEAFSKRKSLSKGLSWTLLTLLQRPKPFTALETVASQFTKQMVVSSCLSFPAFLPDSCATPRV